MLDWLASISTFLVNLVTSIFVFAFTMAKDVLLWFLDGVVSTVVTIICAIPAPSFLSTYSIIGTLNSNMPDFALYVIGHMNVGTALGIILAGILFRLTRKAATFGQW